MTRKEALEIKEILMQAIEDALDEKVINEYGVYYDFEDRDGTVSLFEDEGMGEFVRMTITLNMGDLDG